MNRPSSLEYIVNDFYFHHTADRGVSSYPIHMHDGYEIYYFISGDVTYFIEGTAYELHPNDLLIINNQELHKPQLNSSDVYERKVFHFTSKFLEELNFKDYNLLKCMDNRPLGKNNLIPSYEVLSNNIDVLMQNIELCTGTDVSTQILKKTYAVQLLIALNNIMDNNKVKALTLNKSNERVFDIMQFINDNLASNLSLSLLEDRFYVTKFYLCHQFKQVTGFTLNEYITYRRIMKARELIKLGYPMTDIYRLVGFSDYSNFYKAFKKANGLSPREYKDLTKNKTAF